MSPWILNVLHGPTVNSIWKVQLVIYFWFALSLLIIVLSINLQMTHMKADNRHISRAGISLFLSIYWRECHQSSTSISNLASNHKAKMKIKTPRWRDTFYPTKIRWSNRTDVFVYVYCSQVWHVQSDSADRTRHLATSKTQLLWKLLLWYDTLHRLEFMLLSKTWPFESKLSDTSFEEQLQQNMHNLQSPEKQPCSCVLVLWQRLYCKLNKVF